LLSRYFGSGIWQVDFRNDPAAAAAALNSWAAAQTAGLINQLFPPGVVGSNTDVVLADAGYFKAQWAQPFDAGFSSALPFYVDGRQAQPTAFMNVAEPISVPAEESNGLDEVELPYTGGRFAALVIMPTEQTLPSFLSSLSADSLQRMVDSLQMTSVALQMPRFELSETADENGALRALGILDAFGAADLSNMTPAPGLSVQRVQQSTVLRVTPEGTEAASATGVAIGTALRAATLTITIDHPFLLLVRDTVTNAILFGALIENPTT
jgi:serpin B